MPEQELISHPQIDGMHLFFDTITYRTLHLHPEWELLWVMEEPLSIVCGQRAYKVEPGRMALLSPGQPHELHAAASDCTFLCLQLAPQRFAPSEQFCAQSVYPEDYLTLEQRDAAHRALLDAARGYLAQPACYELLCVGQVSLLLHLLLTHMPVRRLSPGEAAEREKRSARLVRLIRFVDQNYMHKIRLSDFAEREKLSMSYLSHFAKEMLSQSFQEYVNTVRFNCACKLIAAGNRRMLDVCMEAGFSDYRYFSAAFRRRAGMTPEAYGRLPRAPAQDETRLHHSLHSLERFYSREKSLALLDACEARYLSSTLPGTGPAAKNQTVFG